MSVIQRIVDWLTGTRRYDTAHGPLTVRPASPHMADVFETDWDRLYAPHNTENRTCCNPNIEGMEHYYHAGELLCCCLIRPTMPRTPKLPPVVWCETCRETHAPNAPHVGELP
jgi:hypothetical protein